MLKIIIAVFFILHGLVHLLYFGQSQRAFELQPGLTWPDGSWAFAKLVGDRGTRLLASAGCILAALGFVAGSIGLFMEQAWWRPVVAGSAVFSAALFLLLWDGGIQKLDQKGGVGLLIDITILVAVLVFRWPDFGF